MIFRKLQTNSGRLSHSSFNVYGFSTCHEDMLAFRYFLIADASTAFFMDPHGYIASFSVEFLEEFKSLRPSP